MPAITYREWSGGLDRRLPLGVQDADKLWVLKNAYISSGKKIVKRPGLRLVNSALTGSLGLETLNGGLCVFALTGSSFAPPSGVGLFNLTTYNPSELGSTLSDILYAKMFEGFPYVVATHYTGVPKTFPPGVSGIPGTVLRHVARHHYVDGGGSTLITDTNCPHGESVTVAASRIFSTARQVVRFSAVNAARDWTTADDAGFLPTSLNQDTTEECTAVGTFNNALTVLFPEGAQIWDVTVDPAENAIRQRLIGTGTNLPQSLASFYRDLVFASPYGVRSLAVQESVDRIDENDVGVPVDTLVVPVQQAHGATLGADESVRVRGMWIQQLGQYWLIYESSGASRVFAYSFSRSAKLQCWSEYTFPVVITGVASVGGKVYVRSASSLYELAPDQYTDDGTTIEVDVQMAFQDAKTPGVEKMWYGADFVFSGTAQVSYLYEPGSSRESASTTVTGDTRAGQIVPVEISSAAIAPRFQHAASEAFSLDMATLYYHVLSITT